MKFLRRHKRLGPGEFPEHVTRAFVRQTLPSATQAEAKRTMEHLRSQGWSEAKLTQFLPYMPIDHGPPPPQMVPEGHVPPPVSVPADVTPDSLDQQLRTMNRQQIRQVVEQLEDRGWSAKEVAVAVLPHLLPQLPPQDADAILANLHELGLSDGEIARLTPRR